MINPAEILWKASDFLGGVARDYEQALDNIKSLNKTISNLMDENKELHSRLDIIETKLHSHLAQENSLAMELSDILLSYHP